MLAVFLPTTTGNLRGSGIPKSIDGNLTYPAWLCAANGNPRSVTSYP
jgi:hypothetical protein